jgi:hypothetical protein
VIAVTTDHSLHGGWRATWIVHGVLLGVLAVSQAAARDAGPWYSEPAARGDAEALPVGNGCMGGMIFGA